ncbi:hypothetical protein D3C87_1301920 [compost metagenome]
MAIFSAFQGAFASFMRAMRSPWTRRSISMKSDVIVVWGQPTAQKRRPTTAVARKSESAKMMSRSVSK